MLFMIIERFKPGAVPEIYRRLRDQGRSMPEGLTYEGSWIEAGFGRCFQLMACDDARLLQEWVLSWEISSRPKSSRSCHRRRRAKSSARFFRYVIPEHPGGKGLGLASGIPASDARYERLQRM